MNEQNKTDWDQVKEETYIDVDWLIYDSISHKVENNLVSESANVG